ERHAAGHVGILRVRPHGPGTHCAASFAAPVPALDLGGGVLSAWYDRWLSRLRTARRNSRPGVRDELECRISGPLAVRPAFEFPTSSFRPVAVRLYATPPGHAAGGPG